MQIAFFAIPARGDNGLQETLNAFLRSHRVLTVQREFVDQGANSFWALAVEYLEDAAASTSAASGSRKPRVDYKEVLSPADFAVFAKLRDWRKTAAEQEGIPVYAVLTNEQLAAIATTRPASLAQIREVEGIGEAKTGKYGKGMLAVLNEGVTFQITFAGSKARLPSCTAISRPTWCSPGVTELPSLSYGRLSSGKPSGRHHGLLLSFLFSPTPINSTVMPLSNRAIHGPPGCRGTSTLPGAT